MDKSKDPTYLLFRERYLKAIYVVHNLEVMQFETRTSLKVAISPEQKTTLRRRLYQNRKRLATLNKHISAYYLYRSRNHFSSWE